MFGLLGYSANDRHMIVEYSYAEIIIEHQIRQVRIKICVGQRLRSNFLYFIHIDCKHAAIRVMDCSR